MDILIYDRNHNYIDTLVEFGDVNTMLTLNGVNKASFKVPLNSQKSNPLLLEFRNHVEVYDEDTLIWYGLIVQRDFDGPSITIGCYGYLHLLNKRRLLNKTFSPMQYGKLYTQLLNHVNTKSNTLVKAGVFDESQSTSRKVESTDYLLDKLIEFTNDINFIVEVDNEFNLNLLSKRPQEREYIFQYKYDDEFNNILRLPSVSQSELDMCNSIHGEMTIKNEETGEETVITYEQSNQQSIEQYGLLEGVAEINDGVVLEETLKEKVNEELKRVEWILNQLTISISDSYLAPIRELKPGHDITIILEPYFDLKTTVKLLEIEINHTDNTATVTLGQFIQRPQKPQTIIYKG